MRNLNGMVSRRSHFSVLPRGRICICLLLLIVPLARVSESAEVLTVMEFNEQKKNWDQWCQQKTVLAVSGRYEGRVAKQFRLQKFPALITPERTTVLPIGIRGNQRLTVTGVMRKAGTRYHFDASRIATGATDLERLDAKVAQIDSKKPKLLYEVADEYQPLAEFYSDNDIRIRIRQLRTTAFESERSLAKEDPKALSALSTSGKQIGIPDRVLEAIRFQSFVVRLQKKDDSKQLIEDIRKQLNGWGNRNPFPTVTAESAFLKDMTAEYETAAQIDRERMHRRIYRVIRLQQILEGLKADGSNGKDIAATLAEELPEERDEILRLQQLYVQYRLKSVPDLRRSQLESVYTLLEESGREKEFKTTLDQWLASQDRRLKDGQLDNTLLLANHYLFAFDRWKHPEHRDAAIELLKSAWLQAKEDLPQDAAEIETRLAKYGWQRMHDRWMTDREIAALPANDIELATKERRAVVGMKPSGIINALGTPDRRVKVVSSNQVQEIWIYGNVGSVVITVHMQRGRLQAPEEAVATLISRPGN